MPVRWGPRIAHNASTWDMWTSPECASSCPTGGCCSTTCRSAWARAPRSRWSGPTAPARRRCCGSSPASSTPHAGVVTRSGGLGVMRQMVGTGLGAEPTVADLLLSVSPPRVREAAAEVDRCERALMETDDEKTQMRYAEALAEYADAGGYDVEVVWDVCTVAGLGVPYERAKYRELRTLSGGEQKRLVLEFLLRGPDEVLLLDEPDNFLDVPGKIWLEQRIRESREDDPLHQPRPRAAQQHRHPGGDDRARRRPAPATARGPTRAASRRTTRRARTGSSASRSCAAAGTRSTPRSRRWCSGSRSRPSTTTAWRASTRPPRPGSASSRRPARPPSSRASSRCRCGSRAAAPASARWSARTSSSPG